MKKKCTKCKKNKDLTEYAKNERTRDGRTTICKHCINTVYEQRKKVDWYNLIVG